MNSRVADFYTANTATFKRDGQECVPVIFELNTVLLNRMVYLWEVWFMLCGLNRERDKGYGKS